MATVDWRLTPYNGSYAWTYGNLSFSIVADTWFGATDFRTVNGSALDDTLNGGDGNDILRGGAGNDTLYGAAGDDILVGGTGNDVLNGRWGNDTYIFNRGDGADTIIDQDWTAGNKDTVLFGAGLLASTATVSRVGNNLTISWGADSVYIPNFFYSSAYQVELFKFADGTTWGIAEIAQRQNASDSADRITGLNGFANTINGLGGDDILRGGDLNDTLNGGTGNDVLYGGLGNDTLDGGTGNDTLEGGEGNDTYKFAAGAGVDSISDYDSTAGNTDVVVFTDLASSAVGTPERNGYDLVIKYGNNAQLTVSNYFLASSYKIEQFQFSDGVTWDTAAIEARFITNGDANGNTITGFSNLTNRIYGLSGNDTLYGGVLADMLDGGDGNDMLFGGAGNDSLYGAGGDDTLVGGTGNDVLNGRWGNDIYIFNQGDGADTIIDQDWTAGNKDTVLFGAGLLASTATVSRVGNNLTISWGADSVYIPNFFYSSAYQVELLKFADGTTWGIAEIAQRQNASDSADRITGLNGFANTINGLGGDDILRGGDLNDTLNGGTGSDVLYGGLGNDTLDGGTGNDTLEGGAGIDNLDGGEGNDTYKFAAGAGVDTISDNDSTAGNTDVVAFADVASGAVSTAERNGYDLVIKYGNSDQLTVRNYFLSSSDKIEQFQFSDGVTWDTAAIEARFITNGDANGNTITGFSNLTNRIYGLDGNDTLYGGALADLLVGGNGNDYLSAGAGNDTLDGGAGDDTLCGGDGNDVLRAGTGNDILLGGWGNDLYIFNQGDGADTIIATIDGARSPVAPIGTASDNDTVQFGAGLLASTATVSRLANDLSISWGADSVKLTNYFSSSASQFELFKFADGTEWGIADLAQRQNGSDGADAITGLSRIANTINGLAGDDMLRGGDLDDILNGGTGSDVLYGGLGNDTLDGGAGNDALLGGEGSDTYKFGLGGGMDTIKEYDGKDGNTDVLAFGVGISANQLWFRRVGSDLEVSITGSSDKCTIANWYSGGAYHVEQFKLSDGKTLVDTQVQTLVDAMAQFAPPLSMPLVDYQAALNQVIAANWR